MGSRPNLHEDLCEILGLRNVYYNPPESVKLQYPCIKYSMPGMDQKYANDGLYVATNKYEVIVIDPDPDSKIYCTILKRFPMCRLDQRYKADNLDHSVLTLYY